MRSKTDPDQIIFGSKYVVVMTFARKYLRLIDNALKLTYGFRMTFLVPHFRGESGVPPIHNLIDMLA